ncbi:sensor histidine kinase [Mycolicibacter hiberniae]|uniref:histidine kinase n=1 Tax=Mycolicibacter hiberniae TaxID=29314 RepID=A0A7I7X6I7_9MYCO|nr:HAMP domain-containing sensor histidine kinase [Mycolicibacter hiberniae]ORV68665.1 histidine kinase [Mycolicibacter hiberniae]BBZ25316.1 two-component sensor histidine kinase [Mycolicibacter hiberniae]
MCSSRLGKSPHAGTGRNWSLRARLLVSQIVLLTVACLGIGAVTELALYQFLVSQLDHQLQDASHRSARLHGHPLAAHRHHRPRPGPGPDFLDAPGQPAGMVGAVVDPGGPTAEGPDVQAGYLSTSGQREQLSPSAAAQLSEVTAGAPAVTRRLEGIGRYRVVATTARRGDDVVVTGLPLAAVEDTMVRVLLIFGLVTLVAVAAVAAAAGVVTRRALAPLRRVAQTAGEVAGLPLDRGEVTLPVRVAESDANPRTEVGQLGAAVNRMLDHMAAALATRQASETRVRQFVADASHELRTPLTAIRGYTELAQRIPVSDGADSAALSHALSRVQSETERMTQLVEDLLLLARLDSGRPLEHEPVDLSRLAVDTVSDAHVGGPEHHWRLELPDEPVIVPGDAARLHQVVANLLTNAAVHTGPGTMVTLRLGVDGREAVLSVTDDGPGIQAQFAAEIFQRFARGDTSRSRTGGSTGLGLAIASAVVRAHRGSIAVSSAPGRTVFTVRLPR